MEVDSAGDEVDIVVQSSNETPLSRSSVTAL